MMGQKGHIVRPMTGWTRPMCAPGMAHYESRERAP